MQGIALAGLFISEPERDSARCSAYRCLASTAINLLLNTVPCCNLRYFVTTILFVALSSSSIEIINSTAQLNNLSNGAGKGDGIHKAPRKWSRY